MDDKKQKQQPISERLTAQRAQMRRPMFGPGGRRIPEKPKNFKQTIAKLVKYCRAHLPAMIFAICMALGATLISVLAPDRLRELTNTIGAGIPNASGVYYLDLDRVQRIGITLVCMYGAVACLHILQSFVMATITQRITKKMRTEIASKVDRLPLGYFAQTSFGDVLSRVTNDVDTIGTTLNQSVATMATAVTMLSGSIIMMLITDWRLTIAAVCASLIGFGFSFLVMTKSQKYFIAQQRQIGEIQGFVEENYSGHNVVRAYNATQAAKDEYEVIAKRLYSSAWRAQFSSGLMMPFMIFVGNLGYVSVCVTGAWLLVEHGMSFGVIVAFIMYVRLFSQPLSQIAQAVQSLQLAAASGERVFEFLEQKELSDESNKKPILQNIRGDVEFKNVRFGYVEDRIIISDFSAKVAAGQKIAIVGPTGAGKTTMVNLLMRFYELNSGQILIDGVPIDSVPRENIHEQFCMVLQDTWLFEGTIKENIIYSKAGVSDQEVIAACKTIGLHHFIKTLPEGYDTVLSDTATLSEGQKQLLTIARAIIKNSPLLILDEATSSVDTRTERIVQSAMDQLMAGRTSFVIAHRLSTIKNADRILVLKDGDIIESGSHDELLARQGFYADLYNSQFDTV